MALFYKELILRQGDTGRNWSPFFETRTSLFVDATVLMMVGMADDRAELSARPKLLFQILTVLFMALGDGRALMNLGDLFGFGAVSLSAMTIPFTLFGVVGMINAVNRRMVWMVWRGAVRRGLGLVSDCGLGFERRQPVSGVDALATPHRGSSTGLSGHHRRYQRTPSPWASLRDAYLRLQRQASLLDPVPVMIPRHIGRVRTERMNLLRWRSAGP